MTKLLGVLVAVAVIGACADDEPKVEERHRKVVCGDRDQLLCEIPCSSTPLPPDDDPASNCTAHNPDTPNFSPRCPGTFGYEGVDGCCIDIPPDLEPGPKPTIRFYVCE